MHYGRVNEPVQGSIGKNRDVTEEKSNHDPADTKYGSLEGTKRPTLGNG